MTKILASKTDINQAIGLLARDIIHDFADRRPLFVALLRGAMPFASKLMFQIAEQAPDFHPELDYMTISTYGDGQIAGEPRLVADISPKTIVNSRTVIIIDDVIDKGVTAQFAFDYFLARGANDVKLITMIEKDIARSTIPHADYTCFRTGPEWLGGMGLDEADIAPEANRWLNEVRIIQP